MTDLGAWRQQIKENSARLAFAWGSMASTGVGTAMQSDPIMFGLAYIEKPSVAYGVEYPDFDDDPDTGGFPPYTSMGFVHEWLTDGSGLYVGAYVGVSIGGIGTDFSAVHHFTFCGISIKNALGQTRDV